MLEHKDNCIYMVCGHSYTTLCTSVRALKVHLGSIGIDVIAYKDHINLDLECIRKTLVHGGKMLCFTRKALSVAEYYDFCNGLKSQTHWHTVA